MVAQRLGTLESVSSSRETRHPWACVPPVAAMPLTLCDRRSRRCRVHRRYAVIDVETTGFDPVKDRVVEMACTIVDGGRIVSTWTSLVDPGRSIPPRVTLVHGIADHHVRDAPRFDEAARELVRRCADARPVAHNASFDRRFLGPLADRPWLCTIALARNAFPHAPAYGNQSLRRYLEIDAALATERPIIAHRALDDTLVTAHVLMRCLERQALTRANERRGLHELSLSL